MQNDKYKNNNLFKKSIVEIKIGDYSLYDSLYLRLMLISRSGEFVYLMIGSLQRPPPRNIYLDGGNAWNNAN